MQALFASIVEPRGLCLSLDGSCIVSSFSLDLRYCMPTHGLKDLYVWIKKVYAALLGRQSGQSGQRGQSGQSDALRQAPLFISVNGRGFLVLVRLRYVQGGAPRATLSLREAFEAPCVSVHDEFGPELSLHEVLGHDLEKLCTVARRQQVAHAGASVSASAFASASAGAAGTAKPFTAWEAAAAAAAAAAAQDEEDSDADADADADAEADEEAAAAAAVATISPKQRKHKHEHKKAKHSRRVVTTEVSMHEPCHDELILFWQEDSMNAINEEMPRFWQDD